MVVTLGYHTIWNRSAGVVRYNNHLCDLLGCVWRRLKEEEGHDSSHPGERRTGQKGVKERESTPREGGRRRGRGGKWRERREGGREGGRERREGGREGEEGRHFSLPYFLHFSKGNLENQIVF